MRLWTCPGARALNLVWRLLKRGLHWRNIPSHEKRWQLSARRRCECLLDSDLPLSAGRRTTVLNGFRGPGCGQIQRKALQLHTMILQQLWEWGLALFWVAIPRKRWLAESPAQFASGNRCNKRRNAPICLSIVADLNFTHPMIACHGMSMEVSHRRRTLRHTGIERPSELSYCQLYGSLWISSFDSCFYSIAQI